MSDSSGNERRASYSALSALPAWVLVDEQGGIVASVRADSAQTARNLFKDSGQQGARVKRAEIAPTVEYAGPRCQFCESAISEEHDYRQVTGWERIHRDAGGTNAIRMPDRSAEVFACWECVGKLARGLSIQQQALDLA